MTQKPLFVGDTRATFWRTLQTFSLTRIVIVLVLLGYLGVNAGKLQGEKLVVYWGICGGYLGIAVLFWLLTIYWKRRFLLQLVSQVALDIAAISLIYFSLGGLKTGL